MVPVPAPGPPYSLKKFIEVYKDSGIRHARTETVKIADLDIPIAVLERDYNGEVIQFPVMLIYDPDGFEKPLLEGICLALRLDPALALAIKP